MELNLSPNIGLSAYTKNLECGRCEGGDFKITLESQWNHDKQTSLSLNVHPLKLSL